MDFEDVRYMKLIQDLVTQQTSLITAVLGLNCLGNVIL